MKVSKPDLRLVVSNDDDLTLPILKPSMIEPPEGDWLSPLECGTEFKCRDKTGRTPRWLVMEYTHMGKLKGDVMLCPSYNINNPQAWFWVEPIEFCKQWEFRGVIQEPQIPTGLGEKEDGEQE